MKDVFVENKFFDSYREFLEKFIPDMEKSFEDIE